MWYTGNGNGTIGKLDPRTGMITEYKMPDPAARDPHTAVFDKKGTLWFTLQQSNMVGRLVPATGEIKLVTVARPNSKPYGIKLSSDGSLWVACNGSNCLLKVEPQTMEIRQYPLPDPKTTVRRLDIASDGMIWYVNSGLGRLGGWIRKRVRSRNGPLPAGRSPTLMPSRWWTISSGTTSRGKGRMRLSDSIPKTERFQSWAIPSGGIYGGILRHMRPTQRRQPADPPNQYQPHHFGDGQAPNREAISSIHV